MKFNFRIFSLLAAVSVFASCTDQKQFNKIGEHNAPRVEYAPNMYHSEAYEPLTQITEEDAGSWVNSDDDKYGEFYNSNPYNPYSMNMRTPPARTIKYNNKGYLPYTIGKDSLALGAAVKSPLPMNAQVLEDGKVLYTKFCSHCHGETGDGKGPVNDKFKGVANIGAEGGFTNITEGHIFHVITHGKGRMWSHASQLDQEERWKIARYIKENLQKKQQ